ncbi:MAG: phytoene desaturase family protein [Cyanophyceae cyanobacterium]
MIPETVDVVVIGSGLGGLSCAGLLARYGLEVLVCESHSIAGGAAHSFSRQGFSFDSGPSLHSGLDGKRSPNPMRHVLDALGESLPCAKYDSWGVFLPEGEFNFRIGADAFCEVLEELGGPGAIPQWRRLQAKMKPLATAATAMPAGALRSDLGVLQTVGHFAPNLLRSLPSLGKMAGSFEPVMRQFVDNPFILRWLDLLCFLLAGVPAKGISTAEMAFMFAEWYEPDVQLDYPMGGSGALIGALVRGLEKHGGQLQLNAHVDQVLVENGRAAGVVLRNGQRVRATQAVVSNASVWDTLGLLPADSVPAKFRRDRQATPPCASFMHLHLGINATDLPAAVETKLQCHYMSLLNWEMGIEAPQNAVLISIPSVLDPSLAPPGKHAVHVYTPGNEPYEKWEGLDRKSDKYQQQKEQRSQVMWQALERVIPDVRQRTEVTMVGTPLTHERFLRRSRGSYGPALYAGDTLFPGPKTPLPGLVCCGDSTFPGIGVPAVAASGMIAAHTLVPTSKHIAMLKEVGLW